MRRAIHARFDECSSERAAFLWSMYSHYSGEWKFNGPYLDVGAGNLANAILFQQRTRTEIGVGIDIDIRAALGSECLALVRADARALPFRARSFKLVTMISIIEHVKEALSCLSEALRVLRDDGELFLQLPNRSFPIEAHSGLFMYFYLPERIRNWFSEAIGPEWMKDIDTPSLAETKGMLYKLDSARTVIVAGFSYPEFLLPQSQIVRALYRTMRRLGVFHVLPMGYILLARARI